MSERGPTLPVLLLALDFAGEGLPDEEGTIGGASGHILAIRTAAGEGGGGGKGSSQD